MTIEPFQIENESEADSYLHDLLSKPECRSIDVVRQRANTLIKDAALKNYFVTKATELLQAS